MGGKKLNSIFSFSRNSSTVAQLNYNIRTNVNQNQCHKALLLFRQMKQLDIQPDNLTFPFISKACAKLSNLQYSKIIHTHVVKSQFLYDIFVGTAMVDMYVKCDQLDLALKIFDRMPQKDVASWNVMIMGVSHLGFMDRVRGLFVQMRGLQDIKPDSITVIGLIQSSSNAKNLYMVQAVHCFGVQNGTYADVSVGNTLISSYSKCDDLGSAEKVFDEISVDMRTVISWNSMIAGYSHLEKFNETIKLYQKMCREEVRPDLSTILSLLSSIAHPEMLLQGKLVHCHGIKLGCDSNVCVVNTLVSMYSKCAETDCARYLFNSMCERTCVSWTAMISGYAEKGDVNEAFALFHAMEETNEKPDLVTMVALLSACGQTASLEHGRWINKYAISNGFQGSIMVCNALIDMYSKCGSMIEADEIFCNMPERTIISWTSMIAGYALNGNFEEALSLFYHMVESGLKPNRITFLAVLQACTHGGNLEKGQECFTLMTEVYNINPSLEHYACVADLLGRRGKLKEALKFIQNMPMDPDAGVWGALLGACKIHNDVEIGKLAAYHLFKLEPKAAVSYVAMANIYAAEGEWEDVAKVRAMMKGNRLRKSPGQSSVEANGKIHAFKVEDRSHPEELVIYEVLDGLALHFKGVDLEFYETCILD
ncbi:Pentatricopeptide repeat-containing protein [Thalictrum thalictroides]|uniref:Pentatricopeptide repeat-containing protein n=1 Tax=Thalictrum thalictroides TaxID=46969 RepID=A0A7J6X196_THATH|nr:Pentatricopeptide repeat-containing protein [Thalictrum thalictroides]